MIIKGAIIDHQEYPGKFYLLTGETIREIFQLSHYSAPDQVPLLHQRFLSFNQKCNLTIGVSKKGQFIGKCTAYLKIHQTEKTGRTKEEKANIF